MSEWISVKDRLPSKQGEYLTLRNERIIEIISYQTTCDNRDNPNWFHGHGYLVTHWMNLPNCVVPEDNLKPPKATKNGIA